MDLAGFLMHTYAVSYQIFARSATIVPRLVYHRVHITHSFLISHFSQMADVGSVDRRNGVHLLFISPRVHTHTHTGFW